MPWTVSDVDRFKSGLTAAQKRQWVSIANSTLASCLEDGGSTDTCEASAIRQANGSVGTNTTTPIAVAVRDYTLQANDYTIRTETHEGRQHLIVPVIMMVEGVHNGSDGPIYHSADALSRFPSAWDGIPVTVPHPEDTHGNPISANTPETIEQYRVGRVFNTSYADGKLRAEAWLDVEKLRQSSPQALGYIRQARPLDVSIGVFTENEPISGNWQGEAYTAVARNHRPDHLALLPGGRGACSWEDGCGVRVNQQGGERPINDQLQTLQIKELTGKGYQVIQADEHEPGFRDTMRQIQSKLDAMDDDVKLHFLTETFEDTFIFEIQRRDVAGSTLFRRGYTTNEEGVVEFTGEPEEVVRTVEFVTANEDGDTNIPSQNANEGGGIPMTATPCVIEKVDTILQADNQWEEEDRAHLLTLSETRLDGIIALGADGADDTDTDADTDTDVDVSAQMNADMVKQIIKEEFADTEAALGLFPSEIQANMRHGMQLHEERRVSLITHISTNAAGVYTAEELKAMDTPALEKLAQMAKAPVDYTLRGVPPINEGVGAGGGEILLPTGVKLKEGAGAAA